jgi:hypothetical protein
MSSGPGRESVPAARLYAMLSEAFEKARDPNCRRCAMPLPVFRTPPDPAGANWHMGAPRQCPFRCDLVIREVQARLWAHYDMIAFGSPAPATEPSTTPDPAQGEVEPEA